MKTTREGDQDHAPQSGAYRLIAAAFESRESLLALLAAEPHLMHERTGLGETPLHYLAVENQLESVRVLVEHGAQVNTLNKCGGTPLSEAALLGYPTLVAYLLDCGAKLHLPGQKQPALHGAAQAGKAALVAQLLAAGADINEQNDMGETALHLAAGSDQRLATLELLLAAGADTTLLSGFEETALDAALDLGCPECVAALTAAGASLGNCRQE